MCLPAWPFNVQQHTLYYCMKQKHTLIKMCPSMLSKHAIAAFFCLQMEVCCKCAITLVRKIICRVTLWTLVSEVSSQTLVSHNCFWTQVSDFLFWNFCLILQLETSVYSVTDQRWPQNVVRTRKWHTRPSQLYHCCSYYILTSPVIYYTATLHTINCFIYHKKAKFC